MAEELFPTQNTVNNVIDLDLGAIRKKRFRLDHDDNRILELNVSDMNIVQRISETYPKLNALQEKAGKLMDGIDPEERDDNQSVLEDVSIIAKRLAEIDAEMRELLDYMFDANVSEITAPDGSMYDPFNGSFRFEIIISVLMKQYEDNLQSEFKKMEKQLKKHTTKYTRK